MSKIEFQLRISGCQLELDKFFRGLVLQWDAWEWEKMHVRMCCKHSFQIHGKQCKYTKSWRARSQSQLHAIQRTSARRQRKKTTKKLHTRILQRIPVKMRERKLVEIFLLKMQLEKNMVAHWTKRRKKSGNCWKVKIQFSQVQWRTKDISGVFFLSTLCSVKLKVFKIMWSTKKPWWSLWICYKFQLLQCKVDNLKKNCLKLNFKLDVCIFRGKNVFKFCINFISTAGIE